MRPYSSKYKPGSRAETLLGLFYLNVKLVILYARFGKTLDKNTDKNYAEPYIWNYNPE
jgi:hypothetical protein